LGKGEILSFYLSYSSSYLFRKTWGISAGIIALIGFVIWDRRTVLAPAIKKTKELEEEKEVMKKILKEYALKEPKLATVLRGVGWM